MRNMPFNLNLKTKMSLTFTLMGMVILCIVALLTYHYSHAELKKSISTQQTALVSSIAQQLDDRLDLIHEQFKRFARLNAKLLDDPRRLQRQLNGQEDLRVYFDAGMLVIDPEGRIVAEYPYRLERIGTSIPKDREYYQDTLASRKPCISSPYLDTISKEPVIAFTVPILKTDRTLHAILVGRHRLWSGKFLDKLADSRIGRTGFFVIIDKDRDIVVHPNKNRAGERLRPGSNPGLELALKGFEGTIENVNSFGVRGLSSYKHLRSAPWVLAAFFPLSEAYQPLDSAVHYFLLIILGAAIISVLIIRYVTQRMTRPLSILTEHIGTIDDKQGEERLINIDSRDEIGTLAHGFNAMITELDNRQRRLDEEIVFVESLVMNSAAPIFVLGKDHRVIYWNKALEKLTGFSADDMKGTNRHWEPFYEEQRPTMADIVLDNAEGTLSEFYENFRPSLFTEGAFQGEGWFRFASSGRRYLFFQAAPIRDITGAAIGVVETFEDFTETKQIEEMLNEQYSFLQKIIDAIPNPVYYKDRLGRYIGCNRTFEEFFGRPQKNILGKMTHDLNPAIYAAEHEQMDRECIRLASTQTYESMLERSDGEVRKIIVTKAPFYDKKGKAAGLVGTFFDITERQAMEEQVRRLSQAVEQSPVSMVITDTTGTIEYVNPMFCHLTGYSYEEAIGQNPRILNANETADEVFADMWHAISNGGEWHGEFRNRKKNGELFWEQASISPLTDKNGNITHYLGLKEDITPRKLAEAELQKAYDELRTTQIKVFQQEKMASIGQLAAGVAHEINNPMGFISSNLTTLGKYQERINEFIGILSATLAGVAENAEPGELGEQRKRLKIDRILEDIPLLIAESQEGAQRVRKIVQDLKSFSRVDESEYKRANINECLDSTINIAWSEIKYVASLDREYGDIPLVLCYPQQINQVFMNLLVNAAHAITGNGTIRVRTWLEGDAVCVAVSDSGSGISAENLKRIFDPFFTTKEVGKGTGLGLSISYDIIKKHQGEILVESELGKGTTFTVKVPVNGIEE